MNSHSHEIENHSLFIKGRECNNSRRQLKFLYVFDDLKAVYYGHPYVKKYHIYRLLSKNLLRLLTIFRLIDLFNKLSFLKHRS
jgi:hypothetical protein